MAVQLTTTNDVAVYSLSAGKVQPAWLAPAKRKALKKSGDYARRVELLQDFSFPSASQTVSVSGDGRYVIATGTYAPRVRVWDTAELGIKFERYMDATPVAHACISPDYAKLAFLLDDRNVEVHAAYGKHYKTRIPTMGRTLAWHAPTAELLMGCSGPDVYRLSLEEGRALPPLHLGAGASAANKIAISRATGLFAIACDGGFVELFDPRSHKRVARLSVPPPPPRGLAGCAAAAAAVGSSTSGCDAMTAAFEDFGMGLAVGTSDVRALVYDLRHGQPAVTKAHPYGLPVTFVAFHAGPDRLLVTADAQQIKVWHRADGRTFTNVEAPTRMSDIAIASDSPATVGGSASGLLFAAGEQERIAAYYIPALGPAPRWASFLDALTEEVDAYGGGEDEGGMGGASGASTSAPALRVYDDYKFATHEELSAVGLSSLIGTPLLKPYMHGFFMDARLHAKVIALADPSAAHSWRAERVAAAVKAQRGSRVPMAIAQAPAVNAALAERLVASAEARAGGGGGSKPQRRVGNGGEKERGGGGSGGGDDEPRAAPASLLTDPRFASLFEDASFAIDPAEAAVFAQKRGLLAPGAATAGKGATAAGATKAKRRRRASEEEED